MTLLKSEGHAAALNPVTCVKLVKTIVYSKEIYGYELWTRNIT